MEEENKKSNIDGGDNSNGRSECAHVGGKVYFWGFDSLSSGVNKNGNRGKDVHIPIEIKGLKNIIQVACGAFFFAALTTDGKIFTWGCGKKGRLGNGREEDCILPCLLQSVLSKIDIVKISCGTTHSGAISDAGELFTWGCGSKGELGHAETSDSLVPKKVATFAEGVFLKDLSCGHQFTAVISHNDFLFTFGCNNKGKLGLGTKKIEPFVTVPTQVSISNERGEEGFIQVKTVCCGHNILAVVSLDEMVYICGCNNDYNTIPNYKEKVSYNLLPILLPDESIAQYVSCNKGEFYSSIAVLCSNGKLFLWGSNYKGKLGTGDFDERKQPTEVAPVICRVTHTEQKSSSSSSSNIKSEKKPVKDGTKEKNREKSLKNVVYRQISLGGIHSCAVDVNNNLYTFGCGSNGRLGHAESIKHRYLFI